MQALWTNHTVMISVDGEPAHEIPALNYATLRPVRVRVDIYRDDQIKATVEGHKIRKDGTDAVNLTEVRYSLSEATVPDWPFPPAYVREAAILARQVVARGYL